MSAAPARLVVALPAEETALAMLEAALAMAERLEREMVALLLEDRRLLASAALPFTQIVSRTGASEGEFDVQLMERMLRVVAERARHRLQRLGSASRVRWRLERVQGLEALPLAEGDMLAIATSAALWALEPPAGLACPVLVMGRPGGPLVVAHRAGREPLELAVADDGAVRRGSGLPVDQGIVTGDDAHRVGVAAGVGELDGDEQVAGRAPFLAVDAAHHFDEAGELAHGRAVEHHLAGVGAAVGADGGGLEPDELGAAAGEAFVAPPGEFLGAAVERAVAAFHRKDHEAVRQPETAAIQRLGQRRKIRRQRNIQSKTLDVAG